MKMDYEKFYQAVVLSYINHDGDPIRFFEEVVSALNQFREENKSKGAGKCITPHACPNYACPACDCSLQAGTPRP